MSQLLEEPAKTVGASRRSLVDSLAAYLTGGAVGGFSLGVAALIEFNQDHSGAMGLLLLPAGAVGGALVAAELYRTRGWRRFGRAVDLARWVIAFAVTSGSLAMVMLWLGAIRSEQFWSSVGLGAALGAVIYSNFWFEDIRDTWMHQPLTLRRVGVIIGVSAGVFFVVWLVLRSRW